MRCPIPKTNRGADLGRFTICASVSALPFSFHPLVAARLKPCPGADECVRPYMNLSAAAAGAAAGHASIAAAVSGHDAAAEAAGGGVAQIDQAGESVGGMD